MLPAGGHARQRDAGQIPQQRVVEAGMRLARGGPIRQVAQLYAQDRGLQFVQAAVPPALGAEVAARLPMIAESAQASGELFVVGHDHSRVAVRAQILARIKAQASEASHRAGLPPVIACSDGLRIVFDDGDSVLRGKRKNGIHIRCQAEQVDDDDGARARRNAHFDLVRVEVERSGLDIREHRARAERADGAARRNKGERGHDHFISRANAAGMKRQFERFGSRSDADAVAHPAGVGDFLLRAPRPAAPAQTAAR